MIDAFLLGMLAGLVLARIVMEVGFYVAKRRLKHGAFDAARSLSQFVRVTGATAIYRDTGEEARRAKEDPSIDECVAAKTPVP